ncbi:MAG: hypothetical protein WCD86_11930, partial [Ktedonobacteraceae bacterium]
MGTCWQAETARDRRGGGVGWRWLLSRPSLFQHVPRSAHVALVGCVAGLWGGVRPGGGRLRRRGWGRG